MAKRPVSAKASAPAEAPPSAPSVEPLRVLVSMPGGSTYPVELRHFSHGGQPLYGILAVDLVAATMGRFRA